MYLATVNVYVYIIRFWQGIVLGYREKKKELGNYLTNTTVLYRCSCLNRCFIINIINMNICVNLVGMTFFMVQVEHRYYVEPQLSCKIHILIRR